MTRSVMRYTATNAASITQSDPTITVRTISVSSSLSVAEVAQANTVPHTYPSAV